MNTTSLIKISLAVLFFLCLLDMPYGYYQLVRFIALIGFTMLAYESYVKENNQAVIVYVGLAILFQPIFKIALGREVWNFVDVVVGIGLIGSIISRKRNKNNILNLTLFFSVFIVSCEKPYEKKVNEYEPQLLENTNQIKTPLNEIYLKFGIWNLVSEEDPIFGFKSVPKGFQILEFGVNNELKHYISSSLTQIDYSNKYIHKYEWIDDNLTIEHDDGYIRNVEIKKIEENRLITFDPKFNITRVWENVSDEFELGMAELGPSKNKEEISLNDEENCLKFADFNDQIFCLPTSIEMVECNKDPKINYLQNTIDDNSYNTILGIYIHEDYYNDKDLVMQEGLDNYYKIFGINITEGITITDELFEMTAKSAKEVYKTADWSEIKYQIESKNFNFKMDNPIMIDHYQLNNDIFTSIFINRVQRFGLDKTILFSISYIHTKSSMINISYYKNYEGKESLDYAKGRIDYMTLRFLNSNS